MSQSESPPRAVYVQTNEAGANRLVAFARAADGTLAPLGSFPTGGAGDGVPHLTSQGSVVISGDGAHVLVTNAGSGDVSLFAVVRRRPDARPDRRRPARRRRASPSTTAWSTC